MIIGYDMRFISGTNSGVGLYTINLIRSILKSGANVALKMLYSRSNKKNGYVIRWEDRRTRDYFVDLPNRLISGLWAFAGWPHVDYFIGEIDIIHSTNYTLIPATRARKVITIHDLSFLIFPEFANKGARIHFARKIRDYCVRADQIWADSLNTKNDIVDMLAVQPEKIEIIYPIISDSYRPIEDGDQLKRSLNSLGLDRPYILFVGNLEPRKNLVRLVEAYERSGIAGDYALVIAGAPGWSNRAIHDRIDGSPVRKHIIKLGYLHDSDLVAVYNGARYLIYPSLYEGFGMPPLESIKCGTPVIAGNNSSLPEVVGDAGLLVDSCDIDAIADAVKRLAYDDSLRRSLRGNCGLQAAKFDGKLIAAEALAAYGKLNKDRP